MSKASLSQLKNEIASDLQAFGSELKNKGIISDDTPFKDASRQCKSGLIPNVKGKTIPNSNCWGYNLSNVIFKTLDRKKKHHVNPKGATITSIVLDAIVIGNDIDKKSVSDPFAHLEVNIVIHANAADSEPLITCWHLDRDLEGANPPEDLHPIYHFTYGGKNLKLSDKEFNYGSNIVLDTPRFAHLPLDGILGVDFILSNYYGGERRKLCEQSITYNRYLAKVQDLIWRPYAFACTSHWKGYTPSTNNWSTAKIWPQLIIPDQPLKALKNK
jgi:hypothetical protein